MSYLNLTTLELRRIRGDLIQVFKIVHGLDNISLMIFLSYQIILEPEGIVLNLASGIAGSVMLGRFPSLRLESC